MKKRGARASLRRAAITDRDYERLVERMARNPIDRLAAAVERGAHPDLTEYVRALRERDGPHRDLAPPGPRPAIDDETFAQHMARYPWPKTSDGMRAGMLGISRHQARRGRLRVQARTER